MPDEFLLDAMDRANREARDLGLARDDLVALATEAVREHTERVQRMRARLHTDTFASALFKTIFAGWDLKMDPAEAALNVAAAVERLYEPFLRVEKPPVNHWCSIGSG